MAYTDKLFFVLLAALIVLVAMLRNSPWIKEAAIVAFSGLVILTWGLFDLCLFVVILVINYGVAEAMGRLHANAARTLLALAIAFDIGTLALFKYANFMLEFAGSLMSISMPYLTIGVPLAISFYTFHIISYLVDVQAGRIQHVTFRQYVFYLSFFPHVIAGPIIRAWQLVPQIGRIRKNRNDMVMGLHYIITGYFLKTVAADNLAKGIDPIWQGTSGLALSAADHWIVAFLYYCQIYADFAGYSLMAMGMARMLGYKFPANFRAPLLAASLQEFWRRWHITLSKWLRDYLYKPLGGNHKGRPRMLLNLLVTMLLGGLWHGASWCFVIWGAMHGIGLIIERVLGFHRVRTFANGAWLLWWLVIQIWVTIAWVFFRSQTLADAMLFVSKMWAFSAPADFKIHSHLIVLLSFAVPAILHQAATLVVRKLRRVWLPQFIGASSAVMLALCVLIESPSNVFIYFKF